MWHEAGSNTIGSLCSEHFGSPHQAEGVDPISAALHKQQVTTVSQISQWPEITSDSAFGRSCPSPSLKLVTRHAIAEKKASIEQF